MKKNLKKFFLVSGIIITFNTIIIFYSVYITKKYNLSEELSDILMFSGMIIYDLGIISYIVIDTVYKKINKKNNIKSTDN